MLTSIVSSSIEAKEPLVAVLLHEKKMYNKKTVNRRLNLDIESLLVLFFFIEFVYNQVLVRVGCDNKYIFPRSFTYTFSQFIAFFK